MSFSFFGDCQRGTAEGADPSVLLQSTSTGKQYEGNNRIFCHTLIVFFFFDDFDVRTPPYQELNYFPFFDLFPRSPVGLCRRSWRFYLFFFFDYRDILLFFPCDPLIGPRRRADSIYSLLNYCTAYSRLVELLPFSPTRLLLPPRNLHRGLAGPAVIFAGLCMFVRAAVFFSPFFWEEPFVFPEPFWIERTSKPDRTRVFP